jgi:hypothetical protein
MILTSKNNNFIVTFNQGWFYPSVVKKYETYIKKLPIPYQTLHDYMTASVQAMTFPALSAEPVEQVLYEDPYSSKGGKRLETYLSRELTLTFKLYEGYINYWIMFDQFVAYYNLNNKEAFMPDISLTFLDQTGFEFLTVQFHQIVILNISELELNYSSNTAEFKNFTMNFKYNYIRMRSEGNLQFFPAERF